MPSTNIPRQTYTGNFYYPDREKDIESVHAYILNRGYTKVCQLLRAIKLPAHMILLLVKGGIETETDYAGLNMDFLMNLENTDEPVYSYCSRIWPRYGFLILDSRQMSPQQALENSGWGERPTTE
jgi:hypothetical protein